MKHELRHMREQGSGAIVNCSSLGGLVGLPGRAAYHASKHAVIGLTSSAALEYAPRGIRINAICPGTFETPMVAAMIASGELDPAQALANQPIGRLGRADEIASTVLWLCSPGSSSVLGVALPGGRRLHRPMNRVEAAPLPLTTAGAPRDEADTTPGDHPACHADPVVDDQRRKCLPIYLRRSEFWLRIAATVAVLTLDLLVGIGSPSRCQPW